MKVNDENVLEGSSIVLIVLLITSKTCSSYWMVELVIPAATPIWCLSNMFIKTGE